MANETLALVRSRPPEAGDERDYESFCAALDSSARGRAFLAEYARRNRHADTEVLLAALDRLEATMHSQAAANDSERMRRELIALHDAIRAARGAIDDSSAALRAEKFVALIERTERHIAAMLDLPESEPALAIPAPANDEPRAVALMLDPEIPRPQPRSAREESQFVQARPALGLPEVDYFDGAAATPKIETPPALAVDPPVPVKTETAISAIAALIEFPAPGANESPASEKKMEKPAGDPLAAIMALSEAERIALFT